MLSVGSISFLAPWILAGLAALPVLWWLLRAIPPSPKLQLFAGVRLLLGLEDREKQTDKTPWWLLLLRCLAIAAALIGFAQPVVNPSERLGAGSGTLLVLMDQGWASAPDWDDRIAMAQAVLAEADEAGRDVILWPLAETESPPITTASGALVRLQSLLPSPWEPDHTIIAETIEAADWDISEAIWFSDGLAREGTEDLLGMLASSSPLRVVQPQQTAHALAPPRFANGQLVAEVIGASDPSGAQVIAYAEAEGGGERRIAVADAEPVESGDPKRAEARFDLPTELAATVTRIVLADRASAGGAAFSDSAIRHVSVGLVAADQGHEIATLTSALHYLEKALAPWAEPRKNEINDAVAAAPAAIILADHGDLPSGHREALTEWVEGGGLLIRFAGPRLASAIGAQGFGTAQADDPLLPVRLRRGGRVLGGALAWSTPRALGPFSSESPFKGLTPPAEVAVRTQVLAEPSPDLSGKVWAALDDGTPLVTAAPLGEGRVVLFHVSADAEWSSLPLSGLFVEMLGRLLALASGHAAEMPDADALAGTLWRPDRMMGIDGLPVAASALAATVPGEQLATGAGPQLPPGIYTRADAGTRAAGEAESLVLNLTTSETTLTIFPGLPAGVVAETLGGATPKRYGPWFLLLAIAILIADVLGTLAVSGRLSRAGPTTAMMVLGYVLVAAIASPANAQQDDRAAVLATAETTLGFVRTGDARLDRVSERAMVGLGQALAQRTAVEPGPPLGVRPGEDELSFFPVLYWPLTEATLPGRPALDALASYIRDGGLLIVDTQNGASGFGGASAVQMREIARALNLPPLAPVDQEHVLTRTFYLLDTFPGRWRGARIWAEAAPPREEGAADTQDIPQFDRIDDNVSPVIVGSADWASAWAVDEQGYPMFPIGRPGDRQRELAIRFGVNAVMYALTGNYKSDQVHAPAVLQRLGQ